RRTWSRSRGCCRADGRRDQALLHLTRSAARGRTPREGAGLGAGGDAAGPCRRPRGARRPGRRPGGVLQEGGGTDPADGRDRRPREGGPMSTFTFGEVSITRVIEIPRSSYPTSSMLPESTPEAIARHHACR